jgi:type I restriction-modification system DNA methylase subunit
MHWIAPTERDSDSSALEKHLWDAADQFRANSGLKAQEYSGPILGLIFLRFAEVRFAVQRTKLEKTGASAQKLITRCAPSKSTISSSTACCPRPITFLPAHCSRSCSRRFRKFPRTEGQKGGEFYTPSAIVRLLAEVIETEKGPCLHY